MRHGKKFNHLSRQTGHRKSMLANMACSLIEHKRINTTVAKAKALKQFIEPLGKQIDRYSILELILTNEQVIEPLGEQIDRQIDIVFLS